ncbi:hypothetical protein [Aeromicrobium panaciterrae]|uniref:hypothetical protein n=1 Tax=Aeromicrobium panaciterrae TaxID=363861 RepID=UPI0031E43DEB
MSNEIKTRRFIVTVPDMAGEEADIFAADLEEMMPRRFGNAFGKTVKVSHALGESLPEAFISARVAGLAGMQYIELVDETRGDYPLSPFEARQLAGVLLAQADLIEPVE